MSRFLQVKVECYAGYRGEETPRRLLFGPRRVEVVRVVDRWLAPDHRYFKVVGNDGATHVLRHGVADGRWGILREPGPRSQPLHDPSDDSN